MRNLSLQTTYGALRISTSFACDDDWQTPSMLLQIANDVGGRVRLHFTDPEALDQLAEAVRDLQRQSRSYQRRLLGRALNGAS